MLNLKRETSYLSVDAQPIDTEYLYLKDLIIEVRLFLTSNMWKFAEEAFITAILTQKSETVLFYISKGDTEDKIENILSSVRHEPTKEDFSLCAYGMTRTGKTDNGWPIVDMHSQIIGYSPIYWCRKMDPPEEFQCALEKAYWVVA